MKNYHVIYTSSQKNLDGSNGFGIRTASEDIPKEYLQVVKSAVTANKFANDVANCDVPNPRLLLEDGTTILGVPPRYFYQQVDLPGHQPIHVLGRNIYLGFTELFYFKDADGNISGRGGRPGNFLIDLYLFDEAPTLDQFHLLYEDHSQQPHFVPDDPSPRVDNFEMAGYATGNPEMLPAREWPHFQEPRQVAPKAIDLLFAIVQAQLEGKKLVVKCPWRETHRLLADTLALLPSDQLARRTFTTNFTGNGYSLPADICFVNEYYKTAYAGKDLFIDLQQWQPDTKEAKAFMQDVKQAVDDGDLQRARLFSGWMLSDTYAQFRNSSSETIRALFYYCKMPAQFSVDEHLVKDGRLVEDTVKALAQHIGQNQRERLGLFLEKVENDVDMAASIDALVLQVKRLEAFKGMGIDVSSVMANQKQHINDTFMATSADARKAIDALGLGVVRRYTDNLSDGQGNPDLAQYFITMFKEWRPSTLGDVQTLWKQCQNEVLRSEVGRHFSAIFDKVYDTVVSLASKGNARDVAEQLEGALLSPLSQVAGGDREYQRLEQLDLVLNDDDSVVSNSNYHDILSLICKTGQRNGAVGKVVLEKLYCVADPSQVERTVSTLQSVWGAKPDDIIKRLGVYASLDERRRKAIVKEALRVDKGKTLQEAMDVLKEQKFSANETDAYLLNSENYRSAYKSYRRKKFFAGIFQSIASLFKRGDKKNRRTDDERATKGSKPVTNVQRNYTNSDDRRSGHYTKEELLERRLKEHLANNERITDMDLRTYAKRYARDHIEDRDDIQALLKSLLVLLMCTFGAMGVAAQDEDGIYDDAADYSMEPTNAAYGDESEASFCYVFHGSTLNVRTSPSLYKSGRKKKRKDNVAFQLADGDTIFMSNATVTTKADGVGWTEFKHLGVSHYVDASRLDMTPNPRSWKDSNVSTESLGGLLGFTVKAAPWILLVLTLLIFGLSFAFNTPDADSIKGEARDSTGMRPMFMYSLRPYKFFAGLSLRMIIAAALSVLVMLAVGGAIWGVLWVVKILVWILVIVGWITLVVGIICIFAAPPAGIVMTIIGGLIVYFQDPLTEFGDSCVATGLAFFNALNMWDFSRLLVEKYWLHAVVISLTPLAIFLVAAIFMLIVAGLLRAYEWFTTRRYNITHPCPYCHNPSEPAIYYANESEEGMLPTPLRPGIYGLLHITHPTITEDGEPVRMPTLIANGRDQLLRKCPHCDHFINFEAGTEKHVGFIGTPGSGKTTLLCGVIAELKRQNPDMHFTDSVDQDVREAVDYVEQEGCLDNLHVPGKTGVVLKSSVQCILPRRSSGMPFHLYFNDVAGELFTTENFDADLLRFSNDVENIFFVIDPMTMKLNPSDVSPAMKKWLEQDSVKGERGGNLPDIKNSAYSLTNALKKSDRDLGKIDFTFVLVKSDMGYMDHIDKSSAEALERFMRTELKLSNLIEDMMGDFKSVSFAAVSVYKKGDAGIKTLCDNLSQQLELE